MAHYVMDVNFIGQPVARKFTKRQRHGVWQVRMDTIVAGWMVDSTFYPLDTNEGRQTLARMCVSPDMLTEER